MISRWTDCGSAKSRREKDKWKIKKPAFAVATSTGRGKDKMNQEDLDNAIGRRYKLTSEYEPRSDLLTCTVKDMDTATTKMIVKGLNGGSRAEMEFYLFSQMGFGNLIIQDALKQQRKEAGDDMNLTQWSDRRVA